VREVDYSAVAYNTVTRKIKMKSKQQQKNNVTNEKKCKKKCI